MCNAGSAAGEWRWHPTDAQSFWPVSPVSTDDTVGNCTKTRFCRSASFYFKGMSQWLYVCCLWSIWQSGFDLPRQQWSLLNRFRMEQGHAVPAEGNGDLQTLICVLVARPRRCLTLSNTVPWQNWMAAYLGYTLQMKTLFRGWPVMVHTYYDAQLWHAYEKKKFWFVVSEIVK